VSLEASRADNGYGHKRAVEVTLACDVGPPTGQDSTRVAAALHRALPGLLNITGSLGKDGRLTGDHVTAA
jgi:hypothetical protein